MRVLTCCAISLTLAAIGCSGGGGSHPAVPTDPTPQSLPSGPLVTPTSETGTVAELMALQTLTITRDSGGELRYGLEPLRTAEALGDVYNVESSALFSTSPCGDCLQVTGLGYGADGTVLVDLQLRHPFALPTLPYTGASRLDLHAFDVMGYVVTNGLNGPVSFANGAVVARTLLKNPDGYSNLYDDALEPYMSTPAVNHHPYKLFFRDDAPGNFDGASANGFTDLADPQGHNAMAMGEKDIVQYALQFPDDASQLTIGVAIGLSWGQGAKGRGANLTQRQSPVYYLPEFHAKAPWMVTSSVVSSNLEQGVPSSSATVEIRLRDWQIGAPVASGGFDFPNTPRNEVSVASELVGLTLEVPGLLANPIVLDAANPDSGVGVTDDAVWNTIVINNLDAPAGIYYGWVQALDSLTPPATAGIARTLVDFFTVPDYHTGSMVEIEVLEVQNTPPTPSMSPNPAGTCLCGTIQFDASASTDLETPAGLTFEFDFELPSGLPADFVADLGPVANPLASHQYCTVGSTNAAVRVTDGSGATAIAIVPVTVGNGIINPQTEVTVLPAGSFPGQHLNNGNFSGDSRVAVAGDHVYVLVGTNVNPNYSQRLYVSADQGVTWTPGAVLDLTVPAGATSCYPWGDEYLVASPDGTAYVMYQQAQPTVPQPAGDFSNTHLKIFSSENFGTGAWTERFALTTGQKYSLTGAVDPNNPSRVLMGFSGGTCNFRAIKSEGGAAGPWIQFNTDMAPSCDGGFGASMFFAPNNRIYHVSIRYGNPSSAGGVWIRRSDDNGTTWPFKNWINTVGSGPFGIGRGSADPSDPTGLRMAYGCTFNNAASQGFNVFASADGGSTIVRVQSNMDGVTARHTHNGVRYDSGGQLYAYWTSTSGQYRAGISTDHGVTFAPMQNIVNSGVLGAFNVLLPVDCDLLAVYQDSTGAIRAKRF